MRITFLLLAIFALSAGSALADFEAITIKNNGLARVISGVSDILKTTDIKVGDYSLLDQPTMEFMIELDYKDEKVYLVPPDFRITRLDSSSKNKVETLGVELVCKREDLPLTIWIDYIRAPGVLYQQKSMSVLPCKKAKDAVLRRITLEAIWFKNTVQPLSISDSGFGSDAKSAFAFVEPKSGKGVCFDFPSGKVTTAANRSLLATQEMEVTLEKGWESGKIGLGGVWGASEAAFVTYWQFLMDTRHPELAKSAGYGALQKRYPACFAACRYLPLGTTTQVSAVGRIADNRGFIFLSNPSHEAAKVKLPLAAKSLGLSGELKLTNWASPDKPAEIGVRTSVDTVEVEVAARGYSIIGVNVE